MILLVDKIEKSFGARTLFTGATLQVNAGERYALVGPNGAGKTTLLKIIMGIDVYKRQGLGGPRPGPGGG